VDCCASIVVATQHAATQLRIPLGWLVPESMVRFMKLFFSRHPSLCPLA
jgi:hypothetical protein